MEKNNGRTLLYSIVGVIALSIAVFGGTYAWFSATADDTGNVSVTAGTLAITYTAGSENVVASNLKPATVSQVLTAFGQAGTAKCRYGSETGEQICSATTFTIENTGTLSAVVTGKLASATSSFADNKLMYTIFETTPATLTGQPLVATNVATDINLTALSSTLAADAEKTYTLLIWLDQSAVNSGVNNNSGKTFAGTLTVSATQTNAE